MKELSTNEIYAINGGNPVGPALALLGATALVIKVSFEAGYDFAQWLDEEVF